MQERYPIRVVAKITGLSLDTLRAWERRHQAVVPERSDRGRQYREADIKRLQVLSELVRNGHAIGAIAALTDRELAKLLKQPGHPPSEPVEPEGMASAIVSAIASFDSAGATDELNRLAAILLPRDLVYGVVLPLMREVGLRWHSGTFTVAQEHLVSQILRNLLGSMMRLLRPSNGEAKMVFATPAGELHEFGILSAAMLASIAGVEPVYLGPDLPARDIIDAARRTSAKVIVLGVTFPSANTWDEVSKIAAGMPQSAELWLGGAGTDDHDFPKKVGRSVLVKDLAAFENDCRPLGRRLQ